jgi:aspartate/methionine/tyrosine aminotransferase
MPEVRELDKLVTERTRLVFVNYPKIRREPPRRSPLRELSPGRRGYLLVVSDAAYSSSYTEAPPSIFSIPGARDRATSYTPSKTST